LSLYEKHVGSFSRLMSEVRRLDSDAGVRVLGSFRGRRCLIFLTRSVDGYVLILCAASKGERPLPGRRLGAEHFNNASEVQAFLRNATRGHVDAFVY
jgi:hypothetical protein